MTKLEKILKVINERHKVKGYGSGHVVFLFSLSLVILLISPIAFLILNFFMVISFLMSLTVHAFEESQKPENPDGFKEIFIESVKILIKSYIDSFKNIFKRKKIKKLNKEFKILLNELNESELSELSEMSFSIDKLNITGSYINTCVKNRLTYLKGKNKEDLLEKMMKEKIENELNTNQYTHNQ